MNFQSFFFVRYLCGCPTFNEIVKIHEDRTEQQSGQGDIQIEEYFFPVSMPIFYHLLQNSIFRFLCVGKVIPFDQQLSIFRSSWERVRITSKESPKTRQTLPST